MENEESRGRLQIILGVFLFIFTYLSNLYTGHGARIHLPEIKSHTPFRLDSSGALHFEFEFKMEYFCGLVRIYEIKGVEGSFIADASGNSA